MSNQALQEQFTAIYEARSDSIFRFCLLKVSEREQALDIVQETFTRLWQSLTKGTKVENDRAFLFTVANRLIIDWYRKKKALSFSSLEDKDTDELFDPPDEKTANSLSLCAEGRYLISMISELSSGNRSAVYLRYVEGLSPRDIGDILGLSANVASVRINRGINELKRLTGYDIDSSGAEGDRSEGEQDI